MSELFLENDKLRLRAMEPEDLDWLYRLENNTDLWKYGTTNVPYSRYALKRFIEETSHNIYADAQLRLIVAQKNTSKAVGIVDLFDYSPAHARAEVGIVILPEYQKQGIGRKALRLLRYYAKEKLRLHQLYAFVDQQNPVAQKLFIKEGYTRQGIVKDWLQWSENYSDAIIFQLVF